MRRRARCATRACRGALSLVAVAVVVVPATALAAGATGDPGTIALYRAVAANTDAQRAVVVDQSGYMALSATGGAIAYAFGASPVPAGFKPAHETITIAQHAGRVVWLTDVLHAAATPPAVLFVTRAAAFAGVVTGPGTGVGCFNRIRFTTVPYRAGGPWWSVFGDFRPMATRGNQVLVTVTYAWADGRHVGEIDSIDAARQLIVASSLHVARGAGVGHGPLGITQHDRFPTATPSAPAVHLCH